MLLDAYNYRQRVIIPWIVRIRGSPGAG